MARMHSNGKGSSGSKKPDSSAPSPWSNSDKKEVEKLIVELSNAGNSNASIGTILRDRYAVPDVRLLMGERISKILSRNDITNTYPEDMMNLMRRALGLIDHLNNNSKDLHNRRQLALCESKIRRLSRYYKRKGTLPDSWTYKRDQLRLMVE
ncbi:MAG: 30S ribosomal protein S15 [Euryarchaeota archaeon]|nr:30S ribosomal protein S15 [Euryarchaeota archaeon]|tara:strand:+ start:8584 stop:9039 length:456 start_codon:yes stop_codon:yes gene_type:complete